MKRIRLRLLAQINVLIGSLLALLGCSTAKRPAVGDPIICLYGVPTATYKVSGTVSDTHGKPLEGMQVVVKGYKNQPITDTLPTDRKGRYAADYTGFPADTLNIVVHDPNGTYAADSVQVAVPWQEGASVFEQGEKTFKQDLQLKKQ